MKYNQNTHKLRTIWNRNEINKNLIESKIDESTKIKKIYINRTFYTNKKILNYSTEWSYLSKTTSDVTYYIQWNIIFNKLPVKFISFINSAVLIKSADSIIISDNKYINKFFRVKDIFDDNGNPITKYKKVVYIVSFSLQLNSNIQTKLLVQITNPEFYI